MRLFSAADSRIARARPPLRPKAWAISDAFITPIILSAKQKARVRTNLGLPNRNLSATATFGTITSLAGDARASCSLRSA